MKEFYSGERILPKKPVYYKTDEQPELWFTAEQIWEIRGAGNVKTLLLAFPGLVWTWIGWELN